ncbi:MAG: hypothetical protein WA208_19250 [Thermoanaerobaculia bacterium]
MADNPSKDVRQVTGEQKPAQSRTGSEVSHVTRIPGEEAENVVGDAWDELRLAYRIPDSDRPAGASYLTASGRLFDLFGERLRRAAAAGDELAFLSFDDARSAIAHDVVAPDNALSSNYFSKQIGLWKRGASSAKGDRVTMNEARGEIVVPVEGGYVVTFVVLGPREVRRKQQRNRPAAIRWAIRKDGKPVAVEPYAASEESLVPDRLPHSTSPIDRSLFNVGVSDAFRAADRIEASTAAPEIVANLRVIRKALRQIAKVGGIVVVVFALTYIAVPTARASVNRAVRQVVERVERWWRLRFGPAHVGWREGVPAPASRVWRDTSPSWFAGYREIAVHPASVPSNDSDQRSRAAFVKELIRQAAADPGPVMSYQLQWAGGVRVAVIDAGQNSMIRLLAVPNERNQFAPLRFVWGVVRFPVREAVDEYRRRQQGSPPRRGKIDIPAEVFVTSTPEFELPIPEANNADLLFGGVTVTLVIIPESLLRPGQREIARDCEVVEVRVWRKDDVVWAERLADGWRVDLTLP